MDTIFEIDELFFWFAQKFYNISIGGGGNSKILQIDDVPFFHSHLQEYHFFTIFSILGS